MQYSDHEHSVQEKRRKTVDTSINPLSGLNPVKCFEYRRFGMLFAFIGVYRSKKIWVDKMKNQNEARGHALL